MEDLAPDLGNIDLNREIVDGQSLYLQDATQGNPLIIAENAESGQVMIQATQAAQVPAFFATEEFVHQLQLLNENLAQINTRLAGVEDRLAGIGDRLIGVEDRLTGVGNRVTGVNNQLKGINNRVKQLTGTVNGNFSSFRITFFNSTSASHPLPLQKTLVSTECTLDEGDIEDNDDDTLSS